MNRRSFLTAAGTVAAATKIGLLDFASSLYAAQPRPPAKPLVRVVFVHPNVKAYWMGWPGAAYDIEARQRQYTEILTSAARKFSVQLDVQEKPLDDENAVNVCLEQLKNQPPDGLVVVSMSLNQSWPHINNIAKNRGDIPTIVFSPMGTSFTGDLQATRNIPGVYVAAAQDLDWLNFGIRMLRTISDMKNTRICIVAGDKTDDKKLNIIGTTLHYIPTKRFLEESEKVDESDEVRAIAEYYAKNAKKIVEPTKKDILAAAKNYFVCRRLMQAENCHGFSMDCLGPISSRLIQPPCLAFSRLRDEGGLGTCEADWNAAISTRLTDLLFDRPGFMQDPAPNTVKNTLMGAHCTCATKLDGFDKAPAPFILRTHSESNIGVAMQVLWREGQKVTIMKFQGPESIILGTGRVLRNIDTPPAGGCRTSLELELDDVADCRDTKGFHQLFIYGDLELPFKAYCQLAGIKVVHI
jgi:L-fucose isomerase-like protein